MRIVKEYKKKYLSLSLTTRAVLWFTICNFVVKGISFITVPIFSRILSTSEYGTVTIYNSFQQVLMIIATFELSLGSYNKGILKYKECVSDYTSVILLLGNILTLVLFAIVVFFKNIFITLTDTNECVLLLTFVLFLLIPSYNCWLCRKRFNFDYKSAVGVTVGYAIITTIIPLLAVVFFSRTGLAKIVATLLTQIVFCIPFYIVSIRLDFRKKSFYKDVITYTIRYQLPLVFHALSFLALGQADRIMIGIMVGKSEAAVYSVAYSVGQVIILFQTSINQVFQPFRFKKMESDEIDDIRESTNVIVLMVALIVVAFSILSPDLMQMLFSDEYSNAISLMPPIIVSVFFIFLYNVFSDVEAYYNRTSYIMYASLIASLLNIGLNYIGIKIYGFKVCAYTTLICYILLSVLHYFFVINICKKNKIVTPIYNFKFILLISIALIIYMIIISFLIYYKLTLARYFVLLLLAFAVYKNKNIICRTFQKSKLN